MRMSEDDKDFALELFRAHFTAKEAATCFPFGYATLRNLWRGYENAGVEKYDRMDLMLEGRTIYAKAATK